MKDKNKAVHQCVVELLRVDVSILVKALLQKRINQS